MSRETSRWSEEDLEEAKQRMIVRGAGSARTVRGGADVKRSRGAHLGEGGTACAAGIKSSAGSNPAPSPISQSFFVPGPLPGQNEYMGNATRWKYGAAKKRWASTIGIAIQYAKLRPMQRVHITWQWQERNTRRDPDNFTGISKKFILDVLVGCGILPDDGWSEISGWTDHWHVEKDNPGVLVTLIETPH